MLQGENVLLPFCNACENIGDTEGVLCCIAYPRGIPETIFPWGCQQQLHFKVKRGMEEAARRWKEVAAANQ